jgi:hypothetical protein
MSPADYRAFVELLAQALQVYRIRTPVEQLVEPYWMALERCDLSQVRQALWQWEGEHLPKPAEWRREAQRLPAPPGSDGLEVLDGPTRQEYARAEAAGWTADPCGCDECRRAGVATERQRYVPVDGVRVRLGPGGPTTWKMELLHGFRLRRWLEAKRTYERELARWRGRQGGDRGGHSGDRA